MEGQLAAPSLLTMALTTPTAASRLAEQRRQAALQNSGGKPPHSKKENGITLLP